VIFALMCLCCALAFKVFYLAQTELIISRPLLFYKQHILISDIQGITQGDVMIDIDANNPIKHNNISIGNRSTLKLRNGKQVKFSSIEMWGYDRLLKNVYTLMKNSAKRH